MSEFIANIYLEIPPEVPQREVWRLDERFNEIEGVSTDLQESKSILVETLLLLQIVASIAGPIGGIAESVKAVTEAAKAIYEFVHKGEKSYDVVIRKNGQRIEIKNMSIEDIERLLRR